MLEMNGRVGSGWVPRVGVRDIDTCLLLLVARCLQIVGRSINPVHDHHFAYAYVSGGMQR